MKNHLEDKVVVVTGAGSGFGRLVAEQACGLGAKVVGADVDTEQLATVFEALDGGGHDAAHLATDVTDMAQMQALAAFAVDAFGRIDVMVNNAGVMPLSFYADHEQAWKAWHAAIDVNVKGVLNGIAAVYDQMIAQGRGHVVNISSIYSNFATAGAGVYTATKSAVNALSESLRVESQGKIKVSVVRPTGVPKTGLGASVVNPAAVVGIFGQHASTAMDNMMKYITGELPPELTDADSPRLWSLEPEHIADNIVHVMNQPWGISISDITIRATGEDYVL
ncbi:MAG TPA: SDR family oxidoreductase [Acidimicrobiales bacterium]|nr:SDR family oxidoreductase [Acidimicrobiales bacterium]